MKSTKPLLTTFLLLLAAATAWSQQALRPTETGGPLMFEQAVFDVQSYDISVAADPKTRSITGATVMTARTVIPTNVIVLDLDTPYEIASVTESAHQVKF